MPIEIRELVIKATIDPSTQGAQPPASSTTTGSTQGPSEELIKACVDKLLDILKEKNER